MTAPTTFTMRDVSDRLLASGRFATQASVNSLLYRLAKIIAFHPDSPKGPNKLVALNWPIAMAWWTDFNGRELGRQAWRDGAAGLRRPRA